MILLICVPPSSEGSVYLSFTWGSMLGSLIQGKDEMRCLDPALLIPEAQARLARLKMA